MLISLPLKQKIHLLLHLLSIVSVSIPLNACAFAKKPPLFKPNSYVICISDPKQGGLVCNKTGEGKDNYVVPYDQTEDYRAVPEESWIGIESELIYLREYSEHVCRSGT